MSELVITLISSAISNITFVLSMLVIILISACFLGRYVVISKKMIFGALGVLVFEAIALLFFSLSETRIAGEITAFIEGAGVEEDVGNTAKLVYIGIESLVINSIAFVYAFIFYMFSFREKKFRRSLGAILGLYFYYLYMQTTVEYAYVYLSGGNPRTLEEIAMNPQVGAVGLIFQIICLLITAGVLLILYFAYYRKKKFFIIGIRTRWFFILWLLLFTIFPTVPFALDKLEDRYWFLSLIMGILLPVVGTLAPVLLIINASDKSLKERFAFQENYLNAELDYIEQYKNKQTETRAFRHDIVNNLSLMDMMLKDGKTDEAKEHLEELLQNVSALSPEYVTGDEMLDCIVAMKAGKMKEEGIAFSADGVIDGGLGMKPMDICRVFANAFDNAIEAVEALEDGIPKEIKMQIKRTEKFFVIRISNTTKGRVDVQKAVNNPGYTSKKDKDHHGFGILNIRRTVSNYDGMTKFEASDGEFAVSVMIPRLSS